MQAFADVVILSSSVLWWTLVAISGSMAILLIVSWPKEERPGRRTLVLIGAGLIAYSSWKLLDGSLDLWGTKSSTNATPEIVRLATMDLILSHAITIVSAGLIIAGAVRLNRAGSQLQPSS